MIPNIANINNDLPEDEEDDIVADIEELDEWILSFLN